MFETKTYRFTFDPAAGKWQVATPRQWRRLGTSRTGLKTYAIRNIPTYITRADLARQMPHPPEHQTHLDYTLRHLWNQENPSCN